MSDKQREKHVAMYWNGPVTRVEAQKVFDETADVIQKHNEIITKLDMVLAFVVEKAGYTAEEVQAWMNERMSKMQADLVEKAKNNPAQPEQPAQLESQRLVSLA